MIRSGVITVWCSKSSMGPHRPAVFPIDDGVLWSLNNYTIEGVIKASMSPCFEQARDVGCTNAVFDFCVMFYHSRCRCNDEPGVHIEGRST